MGLDKIEYAVSSSNLQDLKKDLNKVAILKSSEDQGLELYLMRGAKIRVDVPEASQEGTTLIGIIGKNYWFWGELTDLPLTFPRYLKRILREYRIGKGYNGKQTYNGMLVPAT